MSEIAVVTGTRAEYGLLSSPMEAIEAHPELSLSVVATGMHLSPQHGRTVEQIEADGFEVDRTVHMLLEGDDEVAMAKGLGIGLSSFAETLTDVDPDAVLVLGDRDEALAAGVAAAHINVPVAHIHGGDAMHGAVIDDSNRHALTKFAHLHFPASERSAERIKRLGEEEWRITVAGAPGLDDILADDYAEPAAVRERYNLDPDRRLLVVVQHPLTTAPDEAGEQMQATLDATEVADAQRLVIYPNSDPGGKRMIEAIEQAEVRAVEDLPRADYLGLLAGADLLVGNSSSGIIEAPSLDLPVVDVGPRQDGRERADNVRSVPHDAQEIAAAVDAALQPAARKRAKECANPYDYGGASERIAARLASTDLEDADRLLRKRLTY